MPLPRPIDLLATALRRPGTYMGHALEAMSIAQCAVRYPGGLLDVGVNPGRPCGDPKLDTPVVLVHGFGHNRSGWYVLERRLRKAGFTSVHTINYNPWLGVPRLAEQLADRVSLIRAVTGAQKVHVVGHSLGGVILRWYVQELGGDETVETAISVASPHEGTVATFIAPGQTARQLRPGSWLVRRLERGARPTGVRWIAYYSNLDLLVQPALSAALRHPALNATNILVKDHGHLSIMISPRTVRSIVRELEGEVAQVSEQSVESAASFA
jgi:triacylglycerol lipase